MWIFMFLIIILLIVSYGAIAFLFFILAEMSHDLGAIYEALQRLIKYLDSRGDL